MRINKAETAELERIADAITANVEKVYAKTISWDAYNNGQNILWGLVSRGEDRVIGSRCSARHSVVIDRLTANARNAGWLNFKA